MSYIPSPCTLREGAWIFGPTLVAGHQFLSDFSLLSCALVYELQDPPPLHPRVCHCRPRGHEEGPSDGGTESPLPTGGCVDRGRQPGPCSGPFWWGRVHSQKQRSFGPFSAWKDHHSGSVLPRLVRRKILSMNRQGQAGWWCWNCRQYVKQSANFCGSCGQQWQPSYGPQDTRGPWANQEGWDWTSRPSSPRRRADISPRRQAWPKKAGKQRGKKGKNSDGGQPGKGPGQASTTAAPSTEDLPAPPQAPPGSAKTPMVLPQTATESPEKAALAQILQTLSQNKEHLPDSVKELLQQQCLLDAQDRAKLLHKTVTAQSQARKELQKNQDGKISIFGCLGKLPGQVVRAVGRTAETAKRAFGQPGCSGKPMDAEAAGGFASPYKTLWMRTADSSPTDEEQDMDTSEARVEEALDQERELAAQRATQTSTATNLLEALAKAKEQAEEGAAVAAGQAGNREGRTASRTPRRSKANTQEVSSSPEPPLDSLKPHAKKDGKPTARDDAKAKAALKGAGGEQPPGTARG